MENKYRIASNTIFLDVRRSLLIWHLDQNNDTNKIWVMFNSKSLTSKLKLMKW